MTPKFIAAESVLPKGWPDWCRMSDDTPKPFGRRIVLETVAVHVRNRWRPSASVLIKSLGVSTKVFCRIT